MKINHISDVTKIIIFAATIIVVCVLCALGFKMANEGKSAVTSGTKKYNEMASKQMSTDVSVYDGSTVLGNELQRIIKQAVDSQDYLAIRVQTGSMTRDYNYVYTDENTRMTRSEYLEVPVRKSDEGYINPDAQFICTLMKDSDDSVVCMYFKRLN